MVLLAVAGLNQFPGTQMRWGLSCAWTDSSGLMCFTTVTNQPVIFSFVGTHRQSDRLVGLVVKASTSGAEDPGSESRLRRDFFGSSHTSDLKIDAPVATLPGTRRYRASAGTGRPGVSIL